MRAANASATVEMSPGSIPNRNDRVRRATARAMGTPIAIPTAVRTKDSAGCQPDYISPGCSQGHAYADFVGSLGYLEGHCRIQAHTRSCQRESSEDARQTSQCDLAADRLVDVRIQRLQAANGRIRIDLGNRIAREIRIAQGIAGSPQLDCHVTGGTDLSIGSVDDRLKLISEVLQQRVPDDADDLVFDRAVSLNKRDPSSFEALKAQRVRETLVDDSNSR